MTDITMPSLSDSMTEGTILTWLKADGDEVAEGEELVEIETDKATMTYESPAAGVLAIVASEGETLAVGAVMARAGAASPSAAPEPVAAPEPAAALEPAAAPEPAAPSPSNGHAPATVPAPTGSDEVAATPVARRLAREHGVDLAGVTGSGPRGRITRADVAAVAGVTVPPATTTPTPAPARGPALPAAGNGAGETRELTRIQQVIVQRISQARDTVPDFQVQTEAAMDRAVDLRSELKASGVATVPSLNDFVLRAAALALRDHPLANGSFQDGRIQLHSHINLGIAVAAEGALIVPTIRDADQRPITEIATESRRLAERVRDGSVTPAELSDGTFTVSNLGMFGMTAIVPVVNVPQAAILGVGAVRAVLQRDDAGAIVDRHLMTLTLSCDHRILYGADAARFLAAIRDLLEQPVRLLL
jgi:pyruvate dehydrogenase E2 component (dihydrolipoyllysine-residue acetyltransferase)